MSVPEMILTGGSSPLARGLQESGRNENDVPGIIPARAGFTGSGLLSDLGGSSPLARGLLSERVPGGDGHRIIPARAGFTPPGGWRGPGFEDHPRSRGVYDSSTMTIRLSAGSSPLARGLHSFPMSNDDEKGIIPARAGFTRGRPRRREHHRGSSPLARGLPERQLPRPRHAGIIPARAGFTRPIALLPV